MPKINLGFFKTLILNLSCIHSKPRKLDIFILFQKYQFVCSNEVNSPPIRQFPSFSIFGHVTSRDNNYSLRHKKTARFTFGEKFILF